MTLKQTLKQILALLIVIIIDFFCNFHKLLADDILELLENNNYSDVVGSFQIGDTLIAHQFTSY